MIEARNTEYEQSSKCQEEKTRHAELQIEELRFQLSQLKSSFVDQENLTKLAQSEMFTYQAKYHNMLQAVDEAVTSLKSTSIKHEVKQRLLDVLTAALTVE